MSITKGTIERTAVIELQAEIHNKRKQEIKDADIYVTKWKPVLKKVLEEGCIELFSDDDKLITIALFCENMERTGLTPSVITKVIYCYKSALKKHLC